MEIVTIIEIGAVSLAVGVNLYQSIANAEERKKLERARIFYESKTPTGWTIEGDTISQTQLCGGCGLNLTPDQIAACTGESCPLYLGNASSPLYMVDNSIPSKPTIVTNEGKRFNIGFTGHLHK